jgi:YbbR domain-containing protein
LVLATVVWLFVKAVTSDTRIVEGVPLEIRVKPGLTVAYSNVRTVKVTVRGTTEDLQQASRAELFAVLDLTDIAQKGRVAATLTTKSIRHPRRVRVVAVEPTSVVVRLDPTTE